MLGILVGRELLVNPSLRLIILGFILELINLLFVEIYWFIGLNRNYISDMKNSGNELGKNVLNLYSSHWKRKTTVL